MATALAFYPPGISRFSINPRFAVAGNALDSKNTENFIDSLPGYKVLQSIRITYDQVSDTEVIASFEPANIAISGLTRHDAYQALVEEILIAFEDWSANEAGLGPGPKRQLAVLRTYLGKTP